MESGSCEKCPGGQVCASNEPHQTDPHQIDPHQTDPHQTELLIRMVSRQVYPSVAAS